MDNPIYCDQCGAPNRPDGRFCTECGEPLEPSSEVDQPVKTPSRRPPETEFVRKRRVRTDERIGNQSITAYATGALYMAAFLTLMVLYSNKAPDEDLRAMTFVGVGIFLAWLVWGSIRRGRESSRLMDPERSEAIDVRGVPRIDQGQMNINGFQVRLPKRLAATTLPDFADGKPHTISFVPRAPLLLRPTPRGWVHAAIAKIDGVNTDNRWGAFVRPRPDVPLSVGPGGGVHRIILFVFGVVAMIPLGVLLTLYFMA